jgi:flagellar hook-associated protein 2
MRNLISSSGTASGTYARLADVGIDINKDGTLSLKSTKFNEALEKNPAEVQKFFGNAGTDAASTGMGQRIADIAKQVLGTEGAISASTTGLQSTIKRNKDKIERINDKAELYEARLRQQYSALDNSMAKLNGLSSYVTAQLAALNKS